MSDREDLSPSDIARKMFKGEVYVAEPDDDFLELDEAKKQAAQPKEKLAAKAPPKKHKATRTKKSAKKEAKKDSEPKEEQSLEKDLDDQESPTPEKIDEAQESDNDILDDEADVDNPESPAVTGTSLPHKTPPTDSREKSEDDEISGKGMLYFVILVAIIALLWWLLAANHATTTQPAIAASVNGHDISMAELDQLYSQLSPSQQQLTSRFAFLNESLIPEQLLYQEAQAEGYAVTEQEVDATLEELLANSPYPKDVIEQQMTGQNITWDQIKESLTVQLSIQNLLNATLDIPDITDEEAMRYYDENRADIVGFDGSPLNYTDVEPDIKGLLASEKRQQLFAIYLTQLRARASIRIMLQQDPTTTQQPATDSTKQDTMADAQTEGAIPTEDTTPDAVETTQPEQNTSMTPPATAANQTGDSTAVIIRDVNTGEESNVTMTTQMGNGFSCAKKLGLNVSTVIYYYTDACPPCMQMLPNVQTVAKEGTQVVYADFYDKQNVIEQCYPEATGKGLPVLLCAGTGAKKIGAADLKETQAFVATC